MQLWDDNGQSLGGAHDFPWGGMYRTRIWQPDEIVVTHHWIEMPSNLAVGRYTLVVGLFRLLHNENLPVAGPNADPELQIARAADLRVAPPVSAVTGTPPDQEMRFGDSMMVNALEVSVEDVGQSGTVWAARAGEALSIDVFWEATARPAQDYSVFLHVSDALDAPPLVQTDAQIGGTFPTGAWRAGDVIHDRLTLTLPDDLAPGSYEVLMGTYFWQTGERLPASMDDTIIPDGRIKIGELVVQSGD